ncbi:MAG: hypothetical protein IJ455_06565 [Agathobacter sp.]|nr:hypothetical protein [Agathobacter sp.]
MKRKLIFCFILCMCFLVGCGGNDDEKDKGKNTETQQESEVDTEKNTETQQEREEITEAEKVANMTEEEYKAFCEVIYSKELLDSNEIEGKHVKIYGIVNGIGSYVAYDTFACVIDNVAKKYDLSKRYISVSPAFKEDIVNNIRIGYIYSGKAMYLLFEEEKDSPIYEYKKGDEITIYGEIVQCWSGPFVIPKYIEHTEIDIPGMDSNQQ